MLNLFQKLEQHELEIKDIKVIKNLFPTRMIYDKKLYKIITFNRKYKISNYTIKLIDNKIEELYINTSHPNAKVSNGEFCIPSMIKGIEYDNLQKNIIENILTTFNIDDCYFTPWGEITYKEIK